MRVEPGFSTVTLDRCVIAHNVLRGTSAAGGAATLRLTSTTITGNVTGVHTNVTGTTESLGNNLILGNGTDVSGTLTVVAPN